MVNQMIVGAYFAIVAEGFALGTKSGLDPKVLYEAIRGGWAQSKILDVSAAAYFERSFKPGGTVNIHWKDLGYALSLAREQNVPTPVTAQVHEIFKSARAAGHGALSQPAIVKLWEELLGLEVK
jgi:2-hydroxy-3-oxopropionate reductase